MKTLKPSLPSLTRPGVIGTALTLIALASTFDCVYAGSDLPTPSEWIEEVLHSEYLINIDTPPAERPNRFRMIRTNEYTAYLQQNPSTDAHALHNIEKRMENTARHRPPREEITIPVVIHVVYSGSSDSISEDQIRSQIDALNRDFTSQDRTISHPSFEYERFFTRVGVANIRFCMAADNNGPAINYTKADNRRVVNLVTVVRHHLLYSKL